MSHKMLRPFIVKVSVLGYFSLHVLIRVYVRISDRIYLKLTYSYE